MVHSFTTPSLSPCHIYPCAYSSLRPSSCSSSILLSRCTVATTRNTRTAPRSSRSTSPRIITFAIPPPLPPSLVRSTSVSLSVPFSLARLGPFLAVLCTTSPRFRFDSRRRRSTDNPALCSSRKNLRPIPNIVVRILNTGLIFRIAVLWNLSGLACRCDFSVCFLYLTHLVTQSRPPYTRYICPRWSARV